MANPLSILSQIGAGLSTVGAGGAGGALSGALQGEQLARKFQTEDEQNRLRVLQGLLMQQQMGPQYKVDAQGRVILETPGQPPKMTGELPTGQYGQARMDLLGQQTHLATQRADLAEERRKLLEEGGGKAPTPTTILGTIQHKAMTKGLESLSPVERSLYDRAEKGTKEPTGLQGWTARANDPRVSPEDRAVAKQIADSILKAEQAKLGTAAQIHADVIEGVKKRALAAKDVKDLAGTETLLNQLEGLIPAMEKKGFLAKDPSALSVGYAEAKRSRFVPFIGQPGDEDLTAWRAHAGTMVRILRSLGDIGPRAISAYQSAIDVIEKPTTAAGARKAFAQLREAVKAAQSGVAAGGGATGPSGSAALPPLPDPSTMAGQTAKWEPTGEYFKSDGVKWDRVPQGSAPGAGASPGAAAGLPKGAHREGGEIVSDSGKYVWKGGAWQPR